MASWGNIEEAMTIGYGLERQFLCHVHGESNPSASVNSSSGLWFCYSCGARGKYKEGDFEISIVSIQHEIRNIQSMMEPQKIYPDIWLDQYDITGPGDYWLDRYSQETCRYFRLGQGVFPRESGLDQHDATIPFHNPQGQLLGVIRRDTTGDRKPKYLYPPHIKLSYSMFNYHRCLADTIVLTEGATDVMAFQEVGINDGMAIYSAHMGDHQASLIHRYEPKIILCAFDQDAAGEAAYRTVVEKLGEYNIIRLTWDTYKDVAAMPLAERQLWADWLLSTYWTTVDHRGKTGSTINS